MSIDDVLNYYIEAATIPQLSYSLFLVTGE